MITARLGQFGPYVQKGEGENRQSASLGKGQIIENLTLEDAIKLFNLPRTIGEYEGLEIIATKGRYGPYIKWGEHNVSLPRGKDPMTVSLEDCINIIQSDSAKKQAIAAPLHEWTESGISVLNGRYGPYIKYNNSNYRIPRGVDAETLTEEACKKIIAENAPTASAKRYSRKK